MAKIRSLIDQTEHALIMISTFKDGASVPKHPLKQEFGMAGVRNIICAIQSKEDHQNLLRPFLLFCEQYGIRRLGELDGRTDIVRAYIEHKIQTKEWTSAKTIQSFQTAIHKLERAAAYAYNLPPQTWWPVRYEVPSFGEDDTEKIAPHGPALPAMIAYAYEHLPAEAGMVLETVACTGLRAAEIDAIRVHHVKPEGLSAKELQAVAKHCKDELDFRVYRQAGSGPCLFLPGKETRCKGDRWRVVNLDAFDPKFPQKMLAFIAGKSSDKAVFVVGSRQMLNYLNKAKEACGSEGKGLHGVRDDFAVNYLERSIHELKRPISDSILWASRLLGHSRSHIVTSYMRSYEG